MSINDPVKKHCDGSHVRIYVLLAVLYAIVGAELYLKYYDRFADGNTTALPIEVSPENTDPDWFLHSWFDTERLAVKAILLQDSSESSIESYETILIHVSLRFLR